MTYEELKKIARLNSMVLVSCGCPEHSFWKNYPSFYDEGTYSGKGERVELVNYMTFRPGDDVDAKLNEGQYPCCRITVVPAGMGVWSDLENLLPVFKSANVGLEELLERVRVMWAEN